MSTKKSDKSDMLGKSTYEIVVEIQEENKELHKQLEIMKNEAMKDMAYITKLEEENKKLHEIRDNREEKIADLEIEICRLKEENEKLKSDLGNLECEFGFECDECEFWKREIKKHKPCLIKEEYVFNLGDYDYMILTSTTPQLKIIKKNNKGISTFTVNNQTFIT